MGAKHQPKADFWALFKEQVRVNRRRDGDGEEVVQAVPFEEEQASSACNQPPALAGPALMERICELQSLATRHDQLNR